MGVVYKGMQRSTKEKANSNVLFLTRLLVYLQELHNLVYKKGRKIAKVDGNFTGKGVGKRLICSIRRDGERREKGERKGGM